jgi:hypothetical protein
MCRERSWVLEPRHVCEIIIIIIITINAILLATWEVLEELQQNMDHIKMK